MTRSGARRRRALGWVLIVAGVVVIGTLGWTAVKAYQAYHFLANSAAEVAELQASVDGSVSFESINAGLASGPVNQLQGDSASALAAVRDPVYRWVSHVPWLGSNLTALGQMASSVHSVAAAGGELVAAAGTLHGKSLAPHNGTFDVGAIESVAGPLQRAAADVDAAQDAAKNINRSHLIGRLNSAVTSLDIGLAKIKPLTDTGGRIGRLLPAMVGAAGPRTYLLVFQNLAESRATGGIFGSYALVRLVADHLTIADQGATDRRIAPFEPPLIAGDPPADRALAAFYSPLMSSYPQDVNFTPDFPTAAALFAQMYRARTGAIVDGVVALDPVALSYLLRGHSPIAIGDGDVLSADNIVATLLSGVYTKYPTGADNAARDLFLANAFTRVFGAVTAGGTDLTATLAAVHDAAAERRLLVWSAHPSEQVDLAATQFGGSIVAGNAAQPSIGVFLNDGTGGKLDYFLHASTTVTAGSCDDQRQRVLSVATTLTDESPSAGLPDYVVGSGVGNQKYLLRINVLLVVPTGVSFGAVTINGAVTAVKDGTEQGEPMAMVTVALRPGAHAVITAAMILPPPTTAGKAVVTPQVITTPMVSPWPTDARSYSTC